MSLTWHLHHCRDSAVGEFLQQHFMYTASLTRRANRQMEHTNIAHPDTLGSQYKILEKALYYRIGYSFACTNTRDLPAWRLAPHLIHQMSELSRIDLSEVFETFFQHLESTLSMLQPARGNAGKKNRQQSK